MILVDTNFLIQGFTPGTSASRRIDAWLMEGEPLRTSIMAWAEYLCGPVGEEEVALAATMVGAPVALELEDAENAAKLFNTAGRRRGSLPDCLIAATCLRLGAALATENLADFRPFEPMGLRIV